MAKESKKTKILIVDDEKPLARALELKLNKEGFEAVVAGDGEEGFKKVKKDEFDLIILDLVMPKMDGFTFIEKARALKVLAPIIVLSNLSQKEDEEKVLKLGASAFYIKSDIPISQIVEKVKQELKL